MRNTDVLRRKRKQELHLTSRVIPRRTLRLQDRSNAAGYPFKLSPISVHAYNITRLNLRFSRSDRKRRIRNRTGRWKRKHRVPLLPHNFRVQHLHRCIQPQGAHGIRNRYGNVRLLLHDIEYLTRRHAALIHSLHPFSSEQPSANTDRSLRVCSPLSREREDGIHFCMPFPHPPGTLRACPRSL